MQEWMFNLRNEVVKSVIELNARLGYRSCDRNSGFEISTGMPWFPLIITLYVVIYSSLCTYMWVPYEYSHLCYRPLVSKLVN